MKRRLRRTVQLRQDVIDIYLYVYPRSPQGAESLLDAIERSLRQLVDVPGIGRSIDSEHPALKGLRVTPVSRYHNYLIYFRAVEAGIEAFRVTQGSRDLPPFIDNIDIEFDENETDDDQA